MGILVRLLPSALKRRILKELSNEEDTFSRVFNTSADWIVITRLSDSTIAEANSGFEAISGYRREEVLGRRMLDFNVWADPEQRRVLIAELMHAGSARNQLVTLRRRDGALRECMVNCALTALDGPTHSHAVWIARDVTEERQAARALQQSESRFVRLFDQSPLPMCYSSTASQDLTTQWNLAWFEAFGFDPVEDQGKSGLTLNVWVNPTERARLLRMTAEGTALSDVEIQMRRRNGELCWISLSTRLFDELSRKMVLFTYFDITERKHAQESSQELNAQLEARVARRTAELQGANEELSQALSTLQIAQDQLVQSEKLAALGALVAGVAHELNTPIGNGLTVATTLEHRIESFQELVAGGLRRSDLQALLTDMQLASEILVRNLGRAAALVVSFKQVAVDQTSSQRRKFDLRAVVTEILVTLTPALRKTACTVSVHIGENLTMDSYPGPLGQVLTNLINNAVLHGFEPGEVGKVEVHAWAKDDRQLVIEARDSGRGIAPDNLHRVFDPFFTTRLGQGGSGLGLHIVHNLVHSVLGGHIEVNSMQGMGTTFRIHLPMRAPERIDGAVLPLSDG